MRMNFFAGIDQVLCHMEYLIDILGEDRVGLGSDFEGAVIPQSIGSVSGLPALALEMQNRGYTPELMNKLCHQNWLNALRRVWGQ